MVYQPQVTLSCNECLHELDLGLRNRRSVFTANSPDVLVACDNALEHYSMTTGHHRFTAELKSTGECFEIKFPLIPREGAVFQGPEREY